MIDNCRNCSLRGDLIKCKTHSCSIRANWYSEEQQKLIDRLKSGILEALDWNWLDEDYPKEVADKLFKLAKL